MPKPTYNHAFTIAFEVPGSTREDGEDVTAQQLRAAIMRRIASIPDAEMLEACGAPYDTMEEKIA